MVLVGTATVTDQGAYLWIRSLRWGLSLATGGDFHMATDDSLALYFEVVARELGGSSDQ